MCSKVHCLIGILIVSDMRLLSVANRLGYDSAAGSWLRSLAFAATAGLAPINRCGSAPT
jgi:hypothetical protein